MKEINYNVIQGDSFILSLTYTNPDGSPIDLTGASAFFEVKDQPGGRIVCATASGLESSPTNDGITFSASAGHITLNVSPEKTAMFNFPRSAYQLQVTTAGGIKTTLMTGWFLVNAGVIDS